MHIRKEEAVAQIYNPAAVPSLRAERLRCDQRARSVPIAVAAVAAVAAEPCEAPVVLARPRAQLESP